jgi:glyoxylase-like metal-dependent hydrolase (beta-lactamase superfamily II)
VLLFLTRPLTGCVAPDRLCGFESSEKEKGMTIEIFSTETPPLGVNAYVVSGSDTGDGVVIDPGAFTSELSEYTASRNIRVHYVLNTHGHFDHIGGNADAVAATGAPLVCHRDDASRLTDPVLNGAAMFGVPGTSPPPDRLVKDGDTLEAGSLGIQVIHTPGHTPGGVCFLIGEDLFSGDTLFAGGVGRVDLPGGNGAELMRSIRDKLLALPPDTRVHPGHGPKTTIGRERVSNPFIDDL